MGNRGFIVIPVLITVFLIVAIVFLVILSKSSFTNTTSNLLQLSGISTSNSLSNNHGFIQSEDLGATSQGFCDNEQYCSMNEACSGVPKMMGVCETEELCSKSYLCGRRNLLSDGSMTAMFQEDILVDDTGTRIGYMLIKSDGNDTNNEISISLNCLNYDGMCEDFDVRYPSSVIVEENDVGIYPIYIERTKALQGLTSLEFSYDDNREFIMNSIDVIFNEDKTCVYQWGGLERSRSVYFEEQSTVDWTSHCL